jgi:hypothetical protein
LNIRSISLIGAALALVAYTAGCDDDESSTTAGPTTTTTTTGGGMGGSGAGTTTTTTTGGGMGGSGGSMGGMGGSGGGMASFCDSYETTCGLGTSGRYADANACMTYRGAASTACAACIDQHLQNAISQGTNHCSHACGQGPCAGPCTAEGDGCMQ